MDRYKFDGMLGTGAYGCVFKAIHRDTGMDVAVKRMRQKYPTWQECLDLDEVKALCSLRHPSIVQLLQVVREEERLYLIFEFVGPNIYQFIKDRTQPLPEPKIRAWLHQALQGLAHLHASGLVHRDIKPENLLLRGATLKIADLGLVRPTSDPEGRPWTTYVSTRWYRAPEVLLQSPAYGPAVDIYALGAVAAELYSLQPLFPGSSEADQLACICSVLGSPTEESFPQGVRLAERLGVQFPATPPANLAEVLPTASTDAVGLIKAMVAWDPANRPTAKEALQHPYFASRPRPALEPATAAALHKRLSGAATRMGEEVRRPEPPLKRLAKRAGRRQRAAVREQKAATAKGGRAGGHREHRQARGGDPKFFPFSVDRSTIEEAYAS